MRGFYTDRALESRCITLEMDRQRLNRRDIPINLPSRQKEEALALRNKLLLFRFRNLGRKAIDETLVDETIEPRLNQIFVPLMSVVANDEVRNDLHAIARQLNDDLKADRGFDVEAQVLQVIRDLYAAGAARAVSVKAITESFVKRFAYDHDRITNKWVGGIVRRKLGLKTTKREGVFVIPPSEEKTLERLYEKYGIEGPAVGEDREGRGLFGLDEPAT
jgi:hypothetical protein